MPRRSSEAKNVSNFVGPFFRKDVDVVVVYVTSPTSLVVGEFDVNGIISDTVEDLWSRTSRYAGIDRDGFLNYFRGREIGHAIKIGSVRKYRRPLPLGETFGIRAPQSFVYLPIPPNGSHWPWCSGTER